MPARVCYGVPRYDVLCICNMSSPKHIILPLFMEFPPSRMTFSPPATDILQMIKRSTLKVSVWLVVQVRIKGSWFFALIR